MAASLVTHGMAPPPFFAGTQGTMSRVLESLDLVRTDSMDITNDPRFFQNSVIDKRLGAFAGLAVVSILMGQSAVGQGFSMKKDCNIFTPAGLCQLVGFTLLSGMYFANVLATYIGVAQPYHTYRLMTAGPIGFECACAYYLDPGIVAWRHLSIKLMLMSLPALIVASAFRFVPKFFREAREEAVLPEEAPTYAVVEGYAFFLLYMAAGACLYYVHWFHEKVFDLKYNVIACDPRIAGLLSQVKTRRAPSGIFGMQAV